MLSSLVLSRHNHIHTTGHESCVLHYCNHPPLLEDLVQHGSNIRDCQLLDFISDTHHRSIFGAPVGGSPCVNIITYLSRDGGSLGGCPVSILLLGSDMDGVRKICMRESGKPLPNATS